MNRAIRSTLRYEPVTAIAVSAATVIANDSHAGIPIIAPTAAMPPNSVSRAPTQARTRVVVETQAQAAP